MILKRVVLCNFRQFIGKQEVCFSDGAERGRNVTVIFGDNGRGKTGIFRAVIFCLFGERQLSQDGAVEAGELQLVNTTAMQQSKQARGAPVGTYVEVEFSHRGCLYQLRRSILGMLENNETIEELKEIKLRIRGADGNWKAETDPLEIERIINGILDSRIKEHFLFDGEKIERLTRASHDQRKEVAKGIRSLLNIDSLENALRATRKLARKLDAELAGKSTGEMPKVILALEQNANRKAALKEESENLEKELQLAGSEKKQVDKDLEKYREIKHLLDQRKELEKQTADAETELRELMSAMRTRAGKCSLLLCLPVVKTVYADLAKKKEHGEIPPQIRKEFIEKILEEGKCICGTLLQPGSKSFKCVLEWQSRVSQSDLQDSALELWRHLSAVMARGDELAEGMEVDLQRYAVKKNELDRWRSRLTDIGAKIGTSEREDAAKLEGHRENLEKKCVEITAHLRIKEAELQQLEEEYKKLVERRRELQRQKGLMSELERRSQLVLDASEALEAVSESFAAEVRKRIGNGATELLAVLLDKESQASLSGVVVTDDYSLQVLDRWEKRFLANISAGQRQILSISFIVALAKTAAGGAALEMPFFMDTPFGRLSFEHRANLIKHIPIVCSQWILLATDTEFTRREAELLKSSGTWGKFYLLKPTEDGNTQIREMDTANVAAMLRSSQESVE